MASMKRKLGADDNSAKTSSKRRRSEVASKSEVSQGKKENTESESKPKKEHGRSMLTKEQPLFPRGGAGLLTPIERKTIHATAVRDAVDEHTAGRDLFTLKSAGDSDGSDDESAHMAKQGSRPKKKGQRQKRRKEEEPNQPTAARIGGLSHKRLAVGSLVFGQVTAISSRDVTVSLPNGLVGHIPLTSVSKQLNAKIQKAVNEDQARSASDDDADADALSLDTYFFIGQCLRVAITSTGDTPGSGSHSKKKLELSSDPALVNVGLGKSSMTVGAVVQAAVSSVEDHGLVMDLGLEDYLLRGFLPAASLPSERTLSAMKEGAVLICQVTSISSNGQFLKLSADPTKQTTLKSAPSVQSFLPGTIAEILLTDIQDSGLAGKVIGMLDVTADIVHSGSYKGKELLGNTYRLGKKVRGRLLYNFPDTDASKLGFSVLAHLLGTKEGDLLPERIALSSTIAAATVIRVEPGLGVYLDIGSGCVGFAHISRVSDSKLQSLLEATGPFKIGSQHRARVLEYNPVDGLYIISLQQSILEQQFLRLEDVPVGEIAKASIERVIVGPQGVNGVIVKLAEGVTGLVPELHLSDIALQRSEKKFREGASVKVRVLSVDLRKRQIRLTLKKTLINSDAKIWNDYHQIAAGESSLGTLARVDAHGALVQFYGSVRGFLPVAEMSEAYIKDARDHFRQGQVLTVNAISIDIGERRLVVSCRESRSTTSSGESSMASLQLGSFVTGVVFETSQDDIVLRLRDSGVIARIPIDHVCDGSLKKRQAAFGKIRVGHELEDLLVLDVQPRQRLVLLCNRASMKKAAHDGQLITGFDHLEPGRIVTGFVSNISSDGVFVSFAGRVTGLITPRGVPPSSVEETDFGMKKFQIVTSRILNVDYKGATPRFWLTLREPLKKAEILAGLAPKPMVEPVDPALQSEDDLVADKITKARIISVKDSQLNVELAKDIQGRIDVSEVFDRWDDIKDRTKPLRQFAPKQVLSVKIIGAHDTRNHRFLPLSHRKGKNTVFELTMKPSSLATSVSQLLGYGEVPVGSSWLGFVNNITQNCLWVNITPSVRGRIKAVDASDDLSLVGDLEKNFPIGSALRVRVLSVNEVKGRLDLTARTGDLSGNLNMKEVSPGMILPGRITKISDRQVLVQLSEDLVGAVDLIDMADDYSEADPVKYQKNEIVRACVVRVDVPNKKISLSLRPSKVLSSSLKPTDPEISNISQLNLDDVYRGFVRNVDDKGLFITLGHGVTAFVRVSHLSDSFLKEWKDNFQRDQLVKGKIISIDQNSGHIQMSLKESVFNSKYIPPVTFNDLKVGDIVTGKAAKVEDFGVFILVDNSQNVRGLCHRSEIAERRIEDARKLFSEGDAVKAKVLKIDVDKHRVNFGLKASYFAGVEGDDKMTKSENDGDEDVKSEDDYSDENNVHGGTLLHVGRGEQELGHDDDEGDAVKSSSDEDLSEDSQDEMIAHSANAEAGLNVGGFDWYGLYSSTSATKRSMSELDTAGPSDKSKKRKKRAEVQVDRTGDLDANGPQSVDDYERLLLGEPDSSLLWLQYMAFHLELGDVDQAREIGERALRSIGLGQDAEKMNVWVALLNLENAYGDNERVEATFKRACEYNDAQEMHSRLTSIYIQSGKQDKADEMFQRMLKKYAQDSKVWTNYATFLFDTAGEADKGRDLLPRALQILPKFTHLDLTSKFAQLEFKSAAGLPERGRTIFEGLISSFPKRIDLYNVLLDLEVKLGDKYQIRGLFERIFKGKLKPKQAKYFFKRWLAFEEEEEGDERQIEAVKARAATWIRLAGNEE